MKDFTKVQRVELRVELRAMFTKLRLALDESPEEFESLDENKLALDNKNNENNLVSRAR